MKDFLKTLGLVLLLTMGIHMRIMAATRGSQWEDWLGTFLIVGFVMIIHDKLIALSKKKEEDDKESHLKK